MSKSTGDNPEFLLKDLRDSVESGEAIFITGAGVSISATPRALNWMDLIQNGALRVASISNKPNEWLDLIETQIKSGDMTDMLAAAKKVKDGFGGPGEFRSWLRDTVGNLEVENSAVLDALAKSGCLIATTNYDSLLSDATNRPPVPWIDESRFKRILRNKEPGILHIHGHWESPNSVVFGSSEYHNIIASGAIQQLLQATLLFKTVIFVGCGEGLDDPNFGKLLEQFDKLWAGSEERHFRLVRAHELGDAITGRDPGSRLFSISYGSSYEDLAPFLLSLSQKKRSHLGEPPDQPVGHSLVTPPGSTSPTTVTLNIEQAVINDLERLRSEVSESVARELQAVKNSWNSGHKGEAIEWLKRTLVGGNWKDLEPHVKASILLFGANMLAAREPAEARRLLEAARELDANLETTHTEALILLASGELDKAADLIRDGSTGSLRRFYASLLLEQGKLGEAEDVLDGLDDDVEVFRLKALLSLLQRNLKAAVEHIESAETAEPSRETVRYIGGVVRFYASYRPEACPTSVEELLLPIIPELCLDNPPSYLRLREAKSRFSSLLKLAERQEIKREYAAWLYATLVSLPDEKEEARQFAEESLTSDPGNSALVRWCIIRGKDVDLSRPREILEVSTRENPDNLSDVLTLCLIYNATRRYEDTLQLLQANRSEFTKRSPGRAVWLANVVTTLVFLKRFKEAEDLLEKEDEEKEVPLELHLEIMSRKSGDISYLIEFALQYFAQSQHPKDLLLLAGLKERQGDWDWIITNGEALSLADRFRGRLLVAVAYFNQGQWSECLARIEQLPFTNAFSKELKVRVLLKLGKLKEAEQSLDELIQEEKQISTLSLELRLAQRQGDQRKLRAIAPRLLGDNEVHIDELIVTANLLKSSDRDLSMALLERAFDMGIPDQLVSQALGVCFQLGDQKSTAFQHLMERSSHLAREGRFGLSLKNIDQFKAIQEKAKEDSQLLQDAYMNGAPVHVILSKTKLPFVLPYHSWLSEYEKQPYPSVKTPLFIRSGRRDQPVPVVSRAQIHADVTAIILAQHFELLDEVEENFSSIGVSSFLQTHLTHMIASLSPTQPDTDAANKELFALIDSKKIGKIEIDADILEEAESLTYGQVLETLAARRSAILLTFGETSETCRSATLSDLMHTLTERSLIPARKRERAQEILGAPEAGTESTELEIESELIVTILDLRQLLQAGIIEESVRHLNLAIPSTEVDRVRSELKTAKLNADAAAWLEVLQKRIARGLEAGKYYQTSALPNYEWEEIELAGLEEFFRSDFGSQAAFWVDDRGLTKGRITEQGAMIIGTFDLLNDLRTRDVICDNRYFDLINRMRASNIQFLPVSSGEILHYLADAKVENGALRESHELRVLRQNLAASLVQAPHLEIPTDEHRGEWAFFMNQNREVERALTNCFKLEEPLETREIRASWLLESLWMPPVGFRLLSDVDTSEDSPNLLFINIVFLFMHGYSGISGVEEVERRCRIEYFDWVWRALVAPRLPCDALVEALVCQLKTHLLHLLPSGDFEIPYEAAAAVVRVYCQDLPEELSYRLSREQEFFDKIGPIAESRLHLDGHQFSTTLILDEVGRVIREGGAVEIADANQAKFTLSMSPSNKISITKGDLELEVPDEMVGLARGSEEGVDTFLDMYLDHFDSSTETAKAQLSQVKTAFEKFELTQDRGRTSPAFRYFQIWETAREGRFAASMLVPPPIPRLLERYRLDPETAREGFVEALEWSTELLCTEGLQLAWDRLSCFPVPLSKNFHEHLLSLPPSDIEKFLELNLARVKSPMRSFHLIDLISAVKDTVNLREKGFERLRFSISPEGFQLAQALSEAAKWSANRLFLADVEADSSTIVSLAWAHAEELVRSLLEAGCPEGSVLSIFASLNGGTETILESFSRPRNYRDIADPKSVSATRFLLSGAACSLENYDLIPDDIIDSIRGLVFPEENSRIPNPGLLYDSTGTNSIVSWLGEFGSESRLLALVDSESVAYLAPTGLVSLGHHLGKILDDDAKRPNAWLYIHWILEARLYDEDLLELLEKILSSLDLKELFESQDDAEARHLLLAAVLGIAGYCQEPCRQQLLNKLTWALRGEEALSTREKTFPHSFLIGLSHLSAAAAEREQLLASSLLDYLSDFPHLGESLRLPLTLLCFHGPRELATALWPVLNLARAY